MAKKSMDKDKCGSKQFAASRDLERMRSLLKAHSVLQPTMQAAATFAEYSQDFGELDVQSLHLALEKQTSECSDGNLERAEAMLTAQAHTLDAIFGYQARCAVNAECVDHLDCHLKLALRAQTQCRATWETLMTIQNPPILGYVRQANIAHGPQQVNNSPAAIGPESPRQDDQNLKNKLMEKQDGERLDSGTARTPSGTYPAMATMGKLNGTKNGKREITCSKKRL